jgi:SSS family solute:Na+ symporter
VCGLLAAGILAAILGSLDSQFLCIGTMFSEDIVRNISGNRMSDRQIVWLTRLFVLAIVIATWLLSMVLPQSVFDLGLWSFSGFTGLFPIVFASVYWRRLTAAGAIASAAATVVSWCWLFRMSEYGTNRQFAFPTKPISLGVAEIPPMLPIVTIFAVSAVTLVVVSLVTRPPGEETLNRFFAKKSDV